MKASDYFFTFYFVHSPVTLFSAIVHIIHIKITVSQIMTIWKWWFQIKQEN